MCDNGFCSDKEFERLINRVKVGNTNEFNGELDMRIEEIEFKLKELGGLKRHLETTLIKYGELTVEHNIDGYLEDLLADTKYTINELQEELSNLDNTEVS